MCKHAHKMSAHFLQVGAVQNHHSVRDQVL